MKHASDIKISNDQSLIDFERVCSFLQGTHWGAGRSPFVMRTSFENSICFIMLEEETQIGFARVVTDKAFIAYIFDLFLFEEARGRGLSKQLMSAILSHPDLANIPSFMLSTRNAHGLYRQFGFQEFTPNGLLLVRRI